MHEAVKRPFGIVLAACLAAGGCGTSKPDNTGPIQPGEHIVVSGEGLSHVALRAYGDMNLWPSLLNANPELTKRPGFGLREGETIVIPERAQLDTSLPKAVFPKELPADYIVMPGDSLHFIAQGCYGDRKLWSLIYDANRHILSERVKEDTRRLIPGQVLRIPARESREQGATQRIPGRE